MQSQNFPFARARKRYIKILIANNLVWKSLRSTIRPNILKNDFVRSIFSVSVQFTVYGEHCTIHIYLKQIRTKELY